MKSKEEIVKKHLSNYYRNKGRGLSLDDILPVSRILPMMEEYAQQSQPSGMRWVMDEIAFLEECVRITKEGDWSTIFVKPMQDRIAKLKDFLSESSPAGAAEGIKCKCPDNIKHGQTSVMCCNHCGLPDEDFWNYCG